MISQDGKDETRVEIFSTDPHEDSHEDEVDAEIKRLRDFSYTVEEEKKVVSKFDWHILSFLTALYMLSYLDRSNIGNAKTAGMLEDLKISDFQYQWLLSIFYIGYICFQWMILLWKILPPQYYVPFIIIGWGIVSSSTTAVSGWSSFMVIRFLLGVFEAGFSPGVPYYLTFFYYRHEVAWRSAIFLGVSPLSSAFAGLLAYGVTREKLAIADWRALFLIEGLPTIAMGFVAFYAIQKEGHACRFLTQREKDIAASRTLKQFGTPKRVRGISLTDALKSLADLKNWCCMLMYFSLNVSFASLPVYMPTIIQGMGYSAIQAQGLSAPPYVVTYIFVLTLAYFSDKLRIRSNFISCITLVGSVGYLLLAFVDLRSVRYLACFLVALGVFPAIPLVITWSGNCHSSDSKKGLAFVFIHVIGQCGPILGTHLFPKNEGPRYQKGCLICFIFLVVASVTAQVLKFHLKRLNKQLDIRYGVERGDSFDHHDISAIEGDNKRYFRYFL